MKRDCRTQASGCFRPREPEHDAHVCLECHSEINQRRARIQSGRTDVVAPTTSRGEQDYAADEEIEEAQATVAAAPGGSEGVGAKANPEQ